jgi:hypothetical protein
VLVLVELVIGQRYAIDSIYARDLRPRAVDKHASSC